MFMLITKDLLELKTDLFINKLSIFNGHLKSLFEEYVSNVEFRAICNFLTHPYFLHQILIKNVTEELTKEQMQNIAVLL